MSADATTAAPTGRKKIAQGKDAATAADAALGHESQNTSSPEGAKEGDKLRGGWQRVKLGQVAEVIMGQAPRGDETNFEQRGTVFVKAGEFGPIRPVVREWTTRPLKFAKTGDVLICVVGATCGKLNLSIDCAIGRSVAALRPGEKTFDSFLHFQLMPKILTLRAGSTGSAQGVLSRDVLAGIDLVLPPLPEQRRIVAEIEKQFTRLEAGVAALRRVQANLKRYRAAVLKAAYEGRLVPTEAELQKSESRGQKPKAKFENGDALLARILTERRQSWQGRGQYKEPAAPDTRNVALATEGWTWASVDQLAEETMIGLDRGRAQQSDDPATGVPYIKMNNVTMDGRVHCDELVFVPASSEEATRFAVQDGDILFNTRNSKELVGKVGLIRNPPVGAIYNNNLMRIRVPAGVSQAFLALQMCSHEFRQRMELVKKATTSVAAVYSKDLLPLAIALPPLAEQTRIVAEVERRLSVVEELEAVVSANLQRATRLRQSILQKAFTGGLV